MKVPLRYQISEYDCGPTSVLNAVSFLFEREDIPPVLIRNIMLYSLDDANLNGEMGTRGTSSAAMRYLSYWIDGLGKSHSLPVSSRYLAGDQVHLREGGGIDDALRRGGAVVQRVLLDDVGHYILLTGQKDGLIYFFDSYIEDHPYQCPKLLISEDHPACYNRILPREEFERKSGSYVLGPTEDREAVILYNETTRLTEAGTIEFFI